MLAILAAIAFGFAAIFAFVGNIVGLNIIIGVIAIGLVLLALHQAGVWTYTPVRTRGPRQP